MRARTALLLSKRLGDEAQQACSDQPGVHQGNLDVILEHAEVRVTIFWVDHLDWDKAHRVALPIQAHHDLGVIVHIVAAVTRAGEAIGEWVDTHAAHAVLDLKGHSLNPDPKVGDIAPDEAALGDRVIVLG